MGLMRRAVLCALAAFLFLGCVCTCVQAQLQNNFYGTTCPLAESIVHQEVFKGVVTNVGFAAGLLRMHFHDCFVRGCDGSVLLNSTATNTAERDSPINNPSLRGFEVIDSAKARLEAACPGVVSCADITAYAARDSVVLTGGIRYDVPGGRRDGTVSMASEVPDNLPAPSFTVDQLTQNFANKGFSQEEMVTLSGAHTIGRSHCSSFSDRLYNFNSTGASDPSLDAAYAAQLQQSCPKGSNDPTLVVPMEPRTPYFFDALYYLGVLKNQGLFTSDQTLLSNAATAAQVRQNWYSGLQWKQKFAAAMVKMGQIGVVTGSSGQIRSKCSVVN